MKYNDFQGEKISTLGFGLMRLPVIDGDQSKVDYAKVEEMVLYAIDHGINYFDTAYPYHAGESEQVMGRILKAYPRDSYFLATKYPGHQISDTYDPKKIFERQLEKCDVDYFDFYLLHNVYENSIKTYEDPKWGIIDYFLEQKRLGRIRHLGFSCHAGVDALRGFLDRHAEEMEFCQIQLNYLDWTLQDAKTKVELLKEYGIPVWVMEPVRGGRLANLTPEQGNILRELRPNETPVDWCFRFLQGIGNVTVVLSGMSNLEQMCANIAAFAERKPLNDAEKSALARIAEDMKDSVPCTSCGYCKAGCPMGLDIPKLIAAYNEIRFAPTTFSAMRIECMEDAEKPSACIGCGQCAQICPQKIEIPEIMRTFDGMLQKIPTWAEVCRERNAAQKD